MAIIETILNIDTLSVSGSDINSLIEDFDYIHIFSNNVNIIKDSDRPAILATTESDENQEDFYLTEIEKRLKDFGIFLPDQINDVLVKNNKSYDEDQIKEIGEILGKTLDQKLGGIKNGISSTLAASISGIDIAIIYNDLIESAMGVGIKISHNGGTKTEDAEEVLTLSYKCEPKSSASNVLALAKSIVNSI